MGQGDSFSGRTENEEGYGPQRVEAPPSAPVTIPATATVAANAFSAVLIQSTPKSAIAVGTVRIPAPVQPVSSNEYSLHHTVLWIKCSYCFFVCFFQYQAYDAYALQLPVWS